MERMSGYRLLPRSSTLGMSALREASLRAIGRRKLMLKQPVLNLSVCTDVRNTSGKISIRSFIKASFAVIETP